MSRFACLCALIVSLALPAAAFEGTVTTRRISVKPAAITKIVGGDAKSSERILEMSAEKLLAEKDAGVETKPSTVSISGSKVRVEAADGIFVLMDTESGLLQVVNTAKRQVMEVSKADMKAAAENMASKSKAVEAQIAKLPPEKRREAEAMLKTLPGAKSDTTGPSLRALGKTETINGYKCAAFETKTNAETTIGWLTQDAKDVAASFRNFAAAEQNIRPGPKTSRMLLTEKGLPVRVQTLAAGGYTLDEIRKIEPKSLSADVFQVPPGFMKVDAAGMAGGGKPK